MAARGIAQRREADITRPEISDPQRRRKSRGRGGQVRLSLTPICGQWTGSSGSELPSNWSHYQRDPTGAVSNGSFDGFKAAFRGILCLRWVEVHAPVGEKALASHR